MSPLYPGRVERALADRWNEIENSQKSAKADLKLMDRVLEKFAAMSSQEVLEAVERWCESKQNR